MKYNIFKIKNIFLLLSVFFLFFFHTSFKAEAEDVITFTNIEITSISQDQVKINWNTNIPTYGRIVYGDNRDDLDGSITENKDISKWHEIKIGNLGSKKTYFYKIVAFNSTNESETYVSSFKTDEYEDGGEIPKISNLEITYVSATAFAVTWGTDILGNSVIEYGTTEDYEKTKKDNDKTVNHNVFIKGLLPNTKYFVRVYSYSENNVKSYNEYRTVTTFSENSKDEEQLLLSYFKPNTSKDSEIGSSFIIISFTASNYAKGSLNVIRKGEKTRKISLDYASKHYIPVIDLSPGSCYDFKLDLEDIFGNDFVSEFNLCTVEANDLDNDNSENSNVITYVLENGIVSEDIVKNYLGLNTVLLKTNDSSKIWYITNQKRHHVLSPNALSEYSLPSSQIKIVSWPEIARYSSVKLVKSPLSSSVYYLHEKNGKTRKIAMPSAEVFLSYQNNAWKDISIISQYDIDSLENVFLVRVVGSNQVYRLSEGSNQSIVKSAFYESFDENDVLNISQTHLDAYQNEVN